MSNDSAAASSMGTTGATSRRRLLAFLGAGGVAAFASLFSRDARAGHDGTNVLHLGQNNTAPAGSTTGLHAHSTTGPTLELFNPSGTALGVHGPSVMEPGPTPTEGPTLALFAGHVSSPVAGHALRAETFGGPVAVRGIASSGFPDPIFGGGPGEGVQGSSGTGTGVVGIATGTGIGVEARAGVGGDSLDAIALNVRGKSRFSTAGAAVIPGGEEMLFVANPAVTGESHISLTLAGDPRQSQVSWIEQDPSAGFTVHLSRPLRKRQDVPLTYFIAEPA